MRVLWSTLRCGYAASRSGLPRRNAKAKGGDRSRSEGGLLPECFARDNHLSRTVRVMPARMGALCTEMRPIAVASTDLLRREFSTYFDNSDYWYAKRPVRHASAYQSMVSGPDLTLSVMNFK